jgi:citrate lyase subunit beta/citryl-CoA lyase
VLAPKVESADSVRQVLALLAGQGVVLVDGQLIENLHVENAQRIVQIAEAISAMTSA